MPPQDELASCFARTATPNALGAKIAQSTPGDTTGAPRAACAALGKGVQSASNAFLTATTSLGVLQPWPLPSSRPVSPRNQAAMITSADSAPSAALLQRVREQYREMPALTLTKPQATRLFGVAPSVCATMLRALVVENFLSRTEEGMFVRSTTH